MHRGSEHCNHDPHSNRQAIADCVSQQMFFQAEGEAVVAELVERAKAINARDDLLCGISELRLYGSMLDPNVETVGDVDVAYELFYKQPPPGKRRSEWHIERAKQSGRNLQFREMLSYGATEVERLLKARKSRLSLMEMFHFEHLQPMPKFQVILKADGSQSVKTRARYAKDRFSRLLAPLKHADGL